ncbi:MAG: hypothetical protein U0871_15120 [Gemmataceae bacterium]
MELAVAADLPRPRAVDPAVPRDLETVVLKPSAATRPSGTRPPPNWPTTCHGF